MIMEAFLVSTGLVALAEIGDKTQLLAFVLAARYRKPVPVISGIFLATIANHGAAAALGAWITSMLSSGVIRWLLGLSFLGMAVWVLVPDKSVETGNGPSRFSPFATTLLMFFLVEIGDKTQVATIALAVEYQSLLTVVAGTTLGMLLVNVPVVILGDKAAHRIPIRFVRAVAALLFAVLGAASLFAGAGSV